MGQASGPGTAVFAHPKPQSHPQRHVSFNYYYHLLLLLFFSNNRKSANILVDELLCTKICDFGLAKRKTLAELPNEAKGVSLSQHSRVMNVRSAAVQFTTLVGTPAWTAPELIANRSYTEKVDVYSFSVFLWELMCRQTPHEGNRDFGCIVIIIIIIIIFLWFLIFSLRLQECLTLSWRMRFWRTIYAL
jgi:serine/threonine protein kinase